MLQPRCWPAILVAVVLVLESVQGLDYINTAPRKRRENDKDITTVLLVDNHGKNSLGRFLSVKPDLGLITSTARTFIQDGVTTEYATQVLGTTLDNGRLYAHLLTKTSRVVYDHDKNTKVYDHGHNSNNNKRWNLDEHQISNKKFIGNTDYISPDSPQLVFPTSIPEILNESPTGNARIPYKDQPKMVVRPDDQVVKVKDLSHENLIIHNDNPANVKPSKVKGWEHLPTFTVKNEFSPSGFSYLGDDLPDSRTERSKLTTAADRKARLLFKAGLNKPNPKDLPTVTYSGFADFTTTVANTVIIFTPHTAEIPKHAEVTKAAGEATIQPTPIFNLPLTTNEVEQPTTQRQYPTFITTEELPTTTIQSTEDSKDDVAGHKQIIINKEDRESQSQDINKEDDVLGPNQMVINKEDRDGKQQPDEPVDLAAKFSVLANEQKQGQTLVSPEVVQPSETQPVMLSTPSDEDIAKILASLQAQAMGATQPLESAKASTIFFDEDPKKDINATPSMSTIEGATTIFFEDDDFSFEPVTSPKVSAQATTEVEETTTEKQEITTQQETTTAQEIVTTTEGEIPTTPQISQNEIEYEEVCHEGTKVVPTTVYKTLTYLTTFYIPLEENDSTSTSIRSNVVVSSEVSSATIPCNVIEPSVSLDTTTEPSQVPLTEPLTTTTEQITTTEKEIEVLTTTTEQPVLEEEEEEEEETTVAQETTTTVTESEPETTEATTEEGEEIELIFKTLYTTYTYLTTYFQDSTSSVASRIVVTTNVITSTLDPASEASDPAIAGLMNDEDKIVVPSRTVSFEDLADIQPTVAAGNSIGDNDDDNDDEEDEEDQTSVATPALQSANGLKTFYTTYTYFTTIFVDGETEISSRTEVYTNYVTPTADVDITPTKLPHIQENDEQLLLQNRLRNIKFDGAQNYSSIVRNKPEINDEDNDVIPTTTQSNDAYVTLDRKKDSDNAILDLSEYETISTMVTDVRSSTSKGEQRFIDSLDKRNVLLDDQIVSESNNESEIVPSPPTLLLQTSYTTFTYFTTQYHGSTSSDVVSRLETVTNVVTTTLTPTQTLSTEDQSLPVTYFTTFTYWTTLYKDGQTRVTSREETISNVVTPDFKPTEAPEAVVPLITSTADQLITPTATIESSVSETMNIIPSLVGDDELTTFYTTYTYYTTSYVGDETILNSRLETVTNVLNKSNEITDNHIGRSYGSNGENQIDNGDKTKAEIKPTGLLSSIVSTIENDGTATVLSTDVFGTYIDGLYAKVLESTSSILEKTIAPSSVEENIKPTGVISINQGKIVDADDSHEMYYTTQAVGTYIDNLYAQVIESTSSLVVDQEKKASLGSDLPVAHRTGLVRLIEGSIVQNKTTTLYESKVLGTLIDGRYAQIIESTSSFILPTSIPTEILPTATRAAADQPEASIIIPTPVVLEGSISTSSDETTTELNEEEQEEDAEDDGRTKSRLSFPSKKRTFTPAIRPFASRPRPTFAPKRNTKSGAAATITRSDFTPTVTAVPASKPNRFGGGRRSSSTAQAIQPTASGGRRFSRPKSTSARRSSSSQIRPTSSGFRRAGSPRSSSLGNIRPSSIFAGNNRFKIRPTAASGLNRSPSSRIVTETPPDNSENELTTNITDNPTDSYDEAGDTTIPLQTTTESARRANPLLKLRRPPISRAPVTRTTPKPSKGNSPARGNNRGTTTTPRPRTTPARPNALLNRQRAGGLFPRRNLFTTTTTPAPQEEEEDEGSDEDLEEEEGDEEEDTDYESSLQLTQTEAAPTTSSPKKFNGVSIKPFRRRFKRQATYSRFRRPLNSRTTAAPAPVEPEYVDEPSSPKTPAFRSRYSANKYRAPKASSTTSAPTTRKRISPTKPQVGRAQFTLREKDSSSNSRSNFKPRNSNVRRTTTASPRSNSRLRSGYLTENSARRPTSSSRANSRVSTSRTRSKARKYQEQNLDDNNYVLPKFDGTITVTFQIPTEATIPVVNGKITEYKNIVTAKLSTEVLSPNQYSTTINPFGKEVKVLLSENTSINGNGATLITQYLLNESPTTSVTFTPTQIRGRKTSFSHVIPSTVYQVEEVVNTIQPALAAQAPLANILLSQLLLGNGVAANPLLGLQNNNPPGIPATPTTEFKTRTTTYVTTVTSTLETVIPLTFRGKEILTTISDVSTQVVTATEFLTDTVVVTPTAAAFGQAPQLNTLLLPLLQQQLQQQQQQQQQQNLLQQIPPAVYNQPAVVSEEVDEQLNVADEVVEEATVAPKRKPKKNKKKAAAKVEPPKETSVITLYVSGRIPGEFTTVLSTVTVGENARKRRSLPVEPSRVAQLNTATIGYFDQYVESTAKDIESDAVSKETESLESIIGDVSKHVTTKSPPEVKATKKYVVKYVKASTEKNFLA
ncbi:uncharacterized protein LOC126745578 [Anthonomus grandis grandis]|uniref:uncharacterized protein LOC126745578 n=1 Tax=Anthonomus grandis grandis TaxID=2921223 RepID=UPI002165D5A2|nr:uncharacterized protein LOC126745578 [Anthonomus grandis grandis]